MYLWNIKELKQHIVKRGLTEAELFLYILVSVALTAFGIEVTPYLTYDEPNSWTYAQTALNILIPIVGTVMAYRANGGSKGKAFAMKYFSISLVVFIRFLVYLIPLMVVLIAYYASAFMDEDDIQIQTGWLDVVLISGWYVAAYVAIVRHIRDTAQA